MPINQEELAPVAPPPQPELEEKFRRLPVQDRNELSEFCKFVREQNIRSYLEIGAKYGGSLWHVVANMPRGSRAVAVDLPHLSTFKRPVSQPYLEEVVRELSGPYKMTLIIGDSTDEKVVEEVRKHAPFDLCLIDANHAEDYVRTDWKNYGPMARIVAFHDISWNMERNPNKQFKIDVPKVWKEIIVGRRVREIRLCPTQDNGFGILFNDA
jgi:predicted O-methyltransferase YrrM